jgi:hypothetical protein
MADKDKKSNRLTTPLFRCHYVNAFRARPGQDGGSAKFGVTAVWDPTKFTPADNKRWAAIIAALSDAVKADIKKPYKIDEMGTYKTGLRKNSNREEPFEGGGSIYPKLSPETVFANLTTSFKPGVIDINKEEISPEEGNDDLLYSGCFARATVNVYTFNQGGGRGVALGLNNLQVIISDPDGKAPRFDSKGNAADDFDDEIDDSWLDETGEPEVGEDY